MKTQMTIGRQFSWTGAFLMALTLVLGAAALVGLGGLEKAVASLSNDSMTGLSTASRVEADLLEMRGDVLKHMATTNPAALAPIESHIEELKQSVGRNLHEYESTITQTEDRQLFALVQPAVDRYYEPVAAALALSHAGSHQEAFDHYIAVATTPFTSAKDSIRALTDYNRREGRHNGATAVSQADLVRWVTWLILACSLVAGTALLFFIVRRVNRALVQAVTDLTTGAQQMHGAAGQIASSSQTLAQGASEQAASLEETSASTQEINSMAQRNTENCQAATKLVTDSETGFTRTNQMLGEMVTAMDEINTASEKISRIIKVIDEIAFQTNILALNAAVEAARAGESGMGFAVVADEVRNLAQRSAQAARDTAALIEDSIQRSRDGKTKVDHVAGAIRTITSDATKIKTLVEEVTLSSAEQARGLEQIAKAVTQMEHVTQSNAAGAEEGASAAEEMNAQTLAVQAIVGTLTAMVATGPSTSRRTAKSSAPSAFPLGEELPA